MKSVVAQLSKTQGVRSLDRSVIVAAADRLKVKVHALNAILNVESNGQCFDAKGRLIILPEKHVFWRELKGKLRTRAQALGLAVRKWKKSNYKGLGRIGSDARWDRLAEMERVSQTAALRSASYGGPQMMGFNAGLCGFSTVVEFVTAMATSEDNQIEAFIAFLEGIGLVDEIRNLDFYAIARRYNGSGQVPYYAGLLILEFEKLQGESWKLGQERQGTFRLGSIGRRVELLQERLVALGYHVTVDGDFGPATRRQLVAFQLDHGLKADGVVGGKTEAGLETAVPLTLQVGNSRDALTVSDLRKRGSKTIAGADKNTVIGAGLVGVAGVSELGDLSELIEKHDALSWLTKLSDGITAIKGPLQPIITLVTGHPFLAAGVAGIAIIVISRNIKIRRLFDAKNWRHVG